MNKKMVFVIALMAMVLVFSCAKKEEPENDYRVSPLDGGKSLEIIAYMGKKQSVNIPSQLHGLSVTKIGKAAFQKREIIKITIPGSVTVIGDNAFADNMITSVNVGSSVTTIGVDAFADNLLVKVNIGNKVTSIGDKAFRNNQLTSVIIPNGVTTIGNGAFFENQLSNVSIPKSVTAIGAEAFARNPLSNITIAQDNTEYIVKDSYLLSKDEKQIILYYGVEKNVTIPASVEVIGAGAFLAQQLTGVTIPNNVTTVGDRAFMENELATVIIPDNVTTIGDGAFYECKTTNITIGAGVNMGRSSFDYGFYYTYNNYGRRAGTYIVRNGYWNRQQ